MEYKIVAVVGFAELTNVVNQHLASGWQLQGGVSIAHRVMPDIQIQGATNYEMVFAQALIKQH